MYVAVHTSLFRYLEPNNLESLRLRRLYSIHFVSTLSFYFRIAVAVLYHWCQIQVVA